ncbi:MAG TPA: hypothetical protein VN768_07175 [Acidimicrobiales bacterium]|nr:hypothetical protein [Acidimicrobiales bacterium]
MRGARTKVQALPGHLHRSEQWNGLRRGDLVEIEGLALRGAAWRFLGYVRNDRNGAESVEVIGGRPGEDRVRSFLPEQVFPVGGRRTGHPSLADAPRLPLG